ncbi:GDSL esterase/lipase At1g29670-like [Nymphaea colorata]|uniref:GDSL esterase/lipase At1g29670-like n=1 Tax=Nymphaea colorata TaxID=210225 RepID=UPI00129DFD3A|nr:GDSL esterase/lipase At1g29670-like [Nymphaea colorata]
MDVTSLGCLAAAAGTFSSHDFTDPAGRQGRLIEEVIIASWFLVFFPFTPSEAQAVPALFMFGDSIVDNGNNAILLPKETASRFLPYGFDFPTGPTGRFTNGMNPGDVFANLLNLPRFIPAVLDPKAKGEMILNGVNYASGGSGILDYPNSEVISMNNQIKLFENTTLPELRAFLNKTQLSSHVEKSIFAFIAGGNDCIELCQRPIGEKECKENLLLVMGNYTLQMKLFAEQSLNLKIYNVKLYGLGARKFVLFGVTPLGCNPAYLPSNNYRCREDLNFAAQSFNNMLRSLVDTLNQDMPAANFVHVNAYKILYDVYRNPAPEGFRVVDKACCVTNSTDSTKGRACVPGSTPCKNRHEYMYYDGAHCTAATYLILVGKAFYSKHSEEVYPVNIARLAAESGLPSF